MAAAAVVLLVEEMGEGESWERWRGQASSLHTLINEHTRVFLKHGCVCVCVTGVNIEVICFFPVSGSVYGWGEIKLVVS